MKYKLREARPLYRVPSTGSSLPDKAKIDKSGTSGSRCPNPHGSQCHDHQMAPICQQKSHWSCGVLGRYQVLGGFWWPLYP